MRSFLAMFLIGYLLGVGIILLPTIRSTPATYSRGERRPGNALRARVASEARSRRRNWGRYAGSRTSASEG